MGDERSGFALISRLKKDDNESEAQNEKEIAATLLSSFFSLLPPYSTPQCNPGNSQITVPPLTEEDVKNAIFSASSFSAGKVDNLPSIARQKLWPLLNNQIIQLFCSFFSQNRLPKKWKIAKIILLRKPDQKSYILSGVYRLISLIFTLRKAMQSAIATRIGYLADKYSLLQGNHFGSLKEKFTVDALLAHQEKVYPVWQDKKVLLLVTFNVKGALNIVAPDVLVNRLREYHILEELVFWIEDFTQN